MTDKSVETQPAAVSETAKQAGEVRARWAWTEPSIWTERMLTALEEGVKGGKWFSLMDKVWRERTLWAAFQQVAANDGAAGVDHQTVEDFERDLSKNLQRLSEQLREGGYRPQAVRRVWIPKPGSTEKRPLGVPAVRDRVVQAALRLVLEPIFERDFAQQSYGFRPQRGCLDALRRVDQLLKQGYTWIVDADLKSYFDTIPHEPLMERVEEKVSDGQILGLVEVFLNQQVRDGMKCWTPEGGTPQGAVLSPMLSNLYLDPLDHQMAGKGIEMVRYADDFVLLCRSCEEAERALGVGAGMDGASRTDAASDQDTDCGRDPGGIRFSGISFPAGPTMATGEEPEQIPGRDPIQNATHPRPELEGHRRRRQPHSEGLVWVLQT